MIVRRGPAIVLSLVLSAAALLSAPGALASDGGAAKDNNVETNRSNCNGDAPTARLKVSTVDGNDSRLQVVGVVFSDDSDLWEWRMKHNGAAGPEGLARGREDIDRAFRVSRTMINFYGVDTVVFRAENLQTGAVCRAVVDF
jgi:hypothetical protein